MEKKLIKLLKLELGWQKILNKLFKHKFKKKKIKVITLFIVVGMQVSSIQSIALDSFSQSKLEIEK